MLTVGSFPPIGVVVIPVVPTNQLYVRAVPVAVTLSCREKFGGEVRLPGC